MSQSKYIRYRFHANHDDPRPVTFPPPGPWWCTGYGDDYSIVIAVFPRGTVLTEYWPEATEVDEEEVDEIKFSGRFRRPDWYTGPGTE